MQKGLEDLSDFSVVRIDDDADIFSYEIRCDLINGKDNPRIFYCNVRNTVDAIIRDSKKRKELDKLNVILTGEYENIFKETLKEIIYDSKLEEELEKMKEPESLGKPDDDILIPIFFGAMGGAYASEYSENPLFVLLTGILSFMTVRVFQGTIRGFKGYFEERKSIENPGYYDYMYFMENLRVG